MAEAAEFGERFMDVVFGLSPRFAIEGCTVTGLVKFKCQIRVHNSNGVCIAIDMEIKYDRLTDMIYLINLNSYVNPMYFDSLKLWVKQFPNKTGSNRSFSFRELENHLIIIINEMLIDTPPEPIPPPLPEPPRREPKKSCCLIC